MAGDMSIGEIIEKTDILAVYERATGLSANGRKYPEYRLLRCFNQDVHTQGDRKPSMIVNTVRKHFTCRVGGCPERGGLLDMIIHTVDGVKNKNDAVNWIKSENLIGYEFDPSNSPKVELFATDDFVSKEVVASHIYQNEAGENHARVLRYKVLLRDGTIDKDLRSFHWDREHGRWEAGTVGHPMLPYRLPQIIEAARAHKTLIWTEGENKVDSVEQTLGLPAGTNMGGSTAVYPLAWAPYFQGLRGVIVLPDCDIPGRKAAEVRTDYFKRIGVPATIFDIAPHRKDAYDIKDWLEERTQAQKTPQAILEEFRGLYERTRSRTLKAS
jgi:hypothetical protein